MFMRRIAFFIFLILGLMQVACADDFVLQAGISLEDSVPDAIFGEWRVYSELIYTDSNGRFKKNNVDLWNISRNNSVIILENPFSGAKASISVKEVDGNRVVFEKQGIYDNQNLNDTVELTVNGDFFTGYNFLILNTISELDGHLLKSQNAKYSLKGEKISGNNVLIEE